MVYSVKKDTAKIVEFIRYGRRRVKNKLVGVKECWNLKSAKLVTKKKVGINDVPPWNHTPIKCLSCYHETGYVMIDSSVK